MKGLITKDSTEKGCDPALLYLGWFWVIFIHCVNHLMELGIQDLKHDEPYRDEFDKILQKLFIMYHYSSQLTLDAEDLAIFNDADFTKLSALHQIRWAATYE